MLPHSLLITSATGGHNGVSSMFEVGQSAFIWTLVIFLLALPFMWKFVFGPILKALEEREEASRNSARAAESAREETERMRAQIQQDLDAARREAAHQVAAAKARAGEREQELLGAAKAEAERERARARAEIETALASAREVLRREAVELGVQVAEQVISREFSEADQQRLVADFQREVSPN